MVSPRSHGGDPAHRPATWRWLARRLTVPGLVGACLVGGWLSGCGGARQPAERPAAAPVSEPADPSALPVLLDPAPPAALTPFAVNPTIAVAARPGLFVAPVADDAGWQSAVAALARGALPAAAPEAFVDAVSAPDAGPTVDAALAPSVYRPGYAGLRIAIRPPPGPAPSAVVIVIEARRSLLDDDARRALGALARQPTVGVLLAAERPRWLWRPGDASDDRAARIAALDPIGPADLAAALAEASAALPADGVVVSIAAPGVPVAAMGRAARVPPGADFAARLAAACRRRPWLDAARLAVDFDARHVERYRLVGFDGGSHGGRRPTLWHGRSTAVLFEVKLRADRPAGALGRVALTGQTPDGRPITLSAALVAAGDPERQAAVALLAAAVAEKLRAAWWARGVEWPRLLADARALATHPGARRLLPVIEQAMRLDRRPDRFADHGPIDGMDPDAVPVLRPR